MLPHRSGLISFGLPSDDAIDLTETSAIALARRVALAVPVYAAAASLLASALGLWWWAERDA